MPSLIAILLCLPILALCQDPDTITANVFKKTDVDGDGNIERPELDQYFKTFDQNNDNRISRHEYGLQVNATYVHDPVVSHNLHTMFDNLDFNNDHHLDTADYDHMFTTCDTDNNQLVSSAEFTSFFKTMLLASMSQ
ncbi:uncharacterized protein LOC131947715 [Physella acuta]|uniref:uncharacterized protein LOC131947715 n=1 Tax=Physella acuta TaxID=109671 RepID=UPI0027DDA6C1|nr:uncharacterized protein LOC131947715 [Physella acuta]